MKKIIKIIKRFILIVMIIVIVGLIFPTWTPNIRGKNSISELKQIEINETKHEIMVRGANVNNPIIIFVHGGPGCSEIPYVTKYQDLLEDDFTIVHYDQRGSGKSYNFFEDYSNLSSELLVEDLLELTDYVLERFHKEKVVLIGHSFGTYIAMQAAAQAPEKYTSYIGIGQMANTVESEVDSLNFCIEQAQKDGEVDDYLKLEQLRNKIENGLTFTPRYFIRKYGGASRLINDNSDYTEGFLLHPEYNFLDIIRYKKGISISQEALLSEILESSLPTFITKLEIPCYFIMGQYDYMTSVQSAKNYYVTIEAPYKDFIVYQNSAHYPQFEEKDRFAQLLIENFRE